MATISAVYENGVFRPLQTVVLPEATKVEVCLPSKAKIETSTPTRNPGGSTIAPRPKVLAKRAEWLSELKAIRARGFTGKQGIPLQELFDDLRDETGR